MSLDDDRECPKSQRVDNPWHTWRSDGDDPYIFCHWCGEVRDALSGRVIVTAFVDEEAEHG